MFDAKEFRKALIDADKTLTAAAEYMEMTPITMRRKMRSGGFYHGEIERFIEFTGISRETAYEKIFKGGE